MNTPVPPARVAARQGLLDRARAARRRRTGRLDQDVVLFVELLRSCGALVPGGAPARAVLALGAVALDRPADVHAALRATLASDRPSVRLFELVFPVFWSGGDVRLTAVEPLPGPSVPAPADTGSGDAGDAGTDGDRPATTVPTVRPTAGRRRGDGPPDPAADRGAVEFQVRRILRALARSPGRRHRTSTTGDRLDLRASLRRGQAAGELVELVWSRPRPRRTRVAVLCDVSSSMAGVTDLFLAVTHAFARYGRLVEAAVFHVDLTLVGAELRRRPRAAALRRLRASPGALSGGTRIGHCLRAFLDAVEPALTPDTVAFVLSDGWDVSEPDLLGAQVQRLRQRVGRVVWCDPHAAAAAFDPQVAGLRAALPHVDDHLDLSHAGALCAVADHFERHPGPRRNA